MREATISGRNAWWTHYPGSSIQGQGDDQITWPESLAVGMLTKGPHSTLAMEHAGMILV